MHKCVFGAKELAEILGISKQALNYRIKAGRSWYGNDVPAPAYVIGAGKIWTYEQIKEKIDKSGNYSEWGQAKDRFKLVVKELERKKG